MNASDPPTAPFSSSLLVGVPAMGSMPEVYAHVGRALHAAQILEGVVVNTVAWAAIEEGWRLSRQEIECRFNKEGGKMLGKLLRRLASLATMPDDLEGRLDRALNLRNDLVHGYFRRNLTLTFSLEGQRQLLDDLVERQRLFEAVTYELLAASRPLRRTGVLCDQNSNPPSV